MCKLKSFIMLKDSIYCSKDTTDSHSELLEELGIADDDDQPQFVRIEITPPNDDYFRPIKEWRYNVDQDYLPDWYVEEYDKERAYKALAEWAEKYIIIGKSCLNLSENTYYVKDCTLTVGNNTEVFVYGKSSLKVYGNSHIIAYDNSHIIGYGKCIIWGYNDCKVIAYNDCKVIAYNDCKVIAYNDCSVTANDKTTVKALDYCHIRANDNSAIEAHDYVIIDCFDNSSVKANHQCCIDAYDNSKVEIRDRVTCYANNCSSCIAYDNSTIISKYGTPEYHKIFDNSIIRDLKTNKIYKSRKTKIQNISKTGTIKEKEQDE